MPKKAHPVNLQNGARHAQGRSSPPPRTNSETLKVSAPEGTIHPGRSGPGFAAARQRQGTVATELVYRNGSAEIVSPKEESSLRAKSKCPLLPGFRLGVWVSGEVLRMSERERGCCYLVRQAAEHRLSQLEASERLWRSAVQAPGAGV